MPFDPSIPLRAVPAAKPFDPIENYLRIATLQHLIQQNKAGQLQIRQHEQEMQDDQIARDAMRGAFDENGNYSFDRFAQNYARGGGSQSALQTYQQGHAATVDRLAQSRKLDLDNIAKHDDLKRGLWGTVINAPEEQRPTLYKWAVEQGVQRGILKNNEVPGDYPGDTAVEALYTSNAVGSQLAKEANEKRQRDIEQQNTDIRRAGQMETGRHNLAQETLTQRGQDITRRGQDMTDSRMRDQIQIARDTKEQNARIAADQKKQQQDLQTQDALQSFDETIAAAEELKNHKGLSTSVGAKGLTGMLPTWAAPGSNASDFKAKLDTFQSKLFLPMVSKLKGMGQLSDAEGKKLTAAAGALNRDMSEEAFKSEIDKIITSLTAARDRKASTISGAQSQGGAPSGYVRIQASDGSLHDIPRQNLGAARQRDPGLRVVQ